MNKPKYKRHNYTNEQIDWLKENVYGIRHEELTKRFNEHFGTNLTTRKIKKVLLARRIKNGLNQSDLTKEMKQFIFDNHKGISNQELTDKINAEFGTNFKVTKIIDYKSYNNLKSGYQYCSRRKDNLEESLRNNGYTYIKVNGEWFPKQRYIFEQCYGKIKDYEAIIFKDGDKTNFNIDNLTKVHKDILGRVASLLTDDEEINDSIILNGLLLDKIKNMEKEGEMYYE